MMEGNNDLVLIILTISEQAEKLAQYEQGHPGHSDDPLVSRARRTLLIALRCLREEQEEMTIGRHPASTRR